MNYGFSQEKIPFFDLEKLKEEAALSTSQGDLEKTIEILDRVNKNDSVYCENLVSKSFYLMKLGRFEEATEVVNEGWSRDCRESELYYFINKGVALENLNRLDDAYNNYSEGIKNFPRNGQLWYNQAVILEKLNQTEEAVKAYQKAIFFKPTYKKPHLQLGNILYKQGKMAQAMMCFNTYILLEPDAEDALSILGSYNNLVISKNTNSPNPDLSLSIDEDAFETIDLVLDNKFALNEGYKIKNIIDLPLIKQNHALLVQLKDFEGAGGFWSQTYVPLYQWVMQSGAFDNFVYTMSYSLENDNYKKVIEKNSKGIKEFITAYQAKWGEVLANSTYRPDLEESGLNYHYLNSYLEAVGKTESGKTVGKYKFFNEDGSYGGEGSFNANGERHETWTWYYRNGQIKEIANYANGLLQGENIDFFENGKPRYRANFVNDELDGEYRFFNEKGAMLQKKHFQNGNLDGLFQAYFAVGEALPEFYVPYSSGDVSEKLIEYFATGGIYQEIQFKDGEPHGFEKTYHLNNRLFSEIIYEKGTPVGEYKTFHSNGNIKELGTYENGKFHGPFKIFYYDGTLHSEITYNNGELHGIYRSYDTDQKLFYEYENQKGKIISYTFYNKDGKIIANGSNKDGEFYYKGYTPYGKLVSEGLYDVAGGMTGKWKFYSANGVLESEGNYLDDMISGEYREYYMNGMIRKISSYENGNLSGYFVEYHPNGKMKSQGWLKDNFKVGEWRDYYLTGELRSINYYHKGSFHGDQVYYGVSGRISHINTLKYGDLLRDQYFYGNEDPFEIIDYVSKESQYEILVHHPNGKINSRVSYLNGIKHGPYEYFDFDGNKRHQGNFLNGSENGEWIRYHSNGKVERVSFYIEGKLHGEVNLFYENGGKESHRLYDYDLPTGIWTSYYPDGEKETVTTYENGEFHGRTEFYGKSGKLQLIRFYDHGRLTGYSYNDKDRNEVPEIPLPDESGKIKAYFDNGQVSREMEYLNGTLVNSYKVYYYDGTPENEFTFIDGYYNGPYINYYPNGKKMNEKYYNYDQLQGKETFYYQNGKIKEERNYINNVREGDTLYYNEKGDLLKKEKYVNGEVLSVEVR